MSTSNQPGQYKAKEKWQSPEKAKKYRHSREPKHYQRADREEEIVGRWIAGLPARALVLDVPCGSGRFVPLLTGRGFRYVGADFSRAMIHEAKQIETKVPTVGFTNADVERLPFRDNSMDCVIIWRLLHHIGDSAIRQSMLREAARVSRSKVVVSFYHPFSFTHGRRLLRRAIFGDSRPISALSHWQLEREAAAGGLRMTDVRSFCKYVSVNWFACFEKH